MNIGRLSFYGFCLMNALFILFCNTLFSQVKLSSPPQKVDSFFLAKKKGLFGRLYKSISRNPSINDNAVPAEKNINDFILVKNATNRYTAPEIK